MAHRVDQVASSIQRALQAAISRGLSDPRVRGLITVTNVSVSPDLAEASVGISIIPAHHATLTLHGLTSAASRLQADVEKTIRIRRMPRLVFFLDDSLKKQAALDAAISRALPASDASDASPPSLSSPSDSEESVP